MAAIQEGDTGYPHGLSTVCPSACLYVYPSVSVYVCVCVCAGSTVDHLKAGDEVTAIQEGDTGYALVCLSVCLSVRLSVYLSICLSISIYNRSFGKL